MIKSITLFISICLALELSGADPKLEELGEKTLPMAQEKMEKVKTVSISQFYKFAKTTNLMNYIESEEDLIRMIKKTVEGKSATAVYFEFTKFDGTRLTFKILLKNLEN